MAADGITMYGAQWCGDCRRSHAFLTDAGVDFEYIDLEERPEAVDVVLAHNGGRQVIPTIVFPDGSVLVEPTNAELGAKVGL